jgi:hypothetical protein
MGKGVMLKSHKHPENDRRQAWVNTQDTGQPLGEYSAGASKEL